MNVAYFGHQFKANGVCLRNVNEEKRGSATGLPSLPHTVKEGTKAGSTALSWLSRLVELLFTLLCTLRNEAPRNLLTFPTNITCRIKVSPTHTPNCLRHLSRARRGVYFLFLFTFPHARECCGGGGSCLPSFLSDECLQFASITYCGFFWMILPSLAGQTRPIVLKRSNAATSARSEVFLFSTNIPSH